MSKENSIREKIENMIVSHSKDIPDEIPEAIILNELTLLKLKKECNGVLDFAAPLMPSDIQTSSTSEIRMTYSGLKIIVNDFLNNDIILIRWKKEDENF